MKKGGILLAIFVFIVALCSFSDNFYNYNGYSGIYPEYLKNSNVFTDKKFSIIHSYSISYFSSSAGNSNLSGMYLANMRYDFNNNWSLNAQVGYVQTKFFSKTNEFGLEQKNELLDLKNIVIPNVDLHYVSPNKKFSFNAGFSYYGTGYNNSAFRFRNW